MRTVLSALTCFLAVLVVVAMARAPLGHARAAAGQAVTGQAAAHAAGGSANVNDATAVWRVLDDFHDAASKADGVRYFACFAPGGVFIGTDSSERWTLDEFRAYAEPYFSKGKGWTYVPRAGRRHVDFSADGNVAWFDEILDNAKYGECRGTGVLVRVQTGGASNALGAWKVAQYSLSVPVPNDLMGDVVKLIRERGGK
jgi:hypothetical protein